jgi:hypothetical protein
MIAASQNPLQEAQYTDAYCQGRDSPETVHCEQYLGGIKAIAVSLE